jgi:UDP-N-acetylmuramate dehydrogenase
MYPTFSMIKNQSLSQYTTFEIGGTTDAFIQARNEKQAIDAMLWANRNQKQIHFLGGGSNLLITDEHLQACVLQLSEHYQDSDQLSNLWQQSKPLALGIWQMAENEQDEIWRVWGGLAWQTVVDLSIKRNLYGIECLTGIPGKVGAAAIQNIGAYGQSFEEVGMGVHTCRLFGHVEQNNHLKINHLSAQDCQWSYRHSLFKKEKDHLILFVDLRLNRQKHRTISEIKYAQLASRLLEKYPQDQYFSAQALAEVVFEIRAEKSMIYQKSDPNHRSAGSFFTNPIVSDQQAIEVQKIAQSMGLNLVSWPDALGKKLSAAWLIEKSGCPAGYRVAEYPHVALSSKHSLCLTNQGGATASEIKGFSEHIQSRVKKIFGVDLSPEVVFWENSDIIKDGKHRG